MAIYLVEIPHQRNAFAWSADAEGVIAQANLAAARSGETVFEKTTPRQLLAQHGYTSVVAARINGEPEISEMITSLASRFGMDTTIYKGFGEASDWQTKPIDDLTCALNYIGHDLHLLKVYMTDADARSAAENDDRWYCHQGAKAQSALRRLLVSDGVIVETSEEE